MCGLRTHPTDRHLARALLLCLGFLQPVLAACTESSQPQQQEAAAPLQEPTTATSPVSLDRQYRDVLESAAALRAVAGQQPDNVAALRRYAEELRRRLEVLARPVGSGPVAKGEAIEAGKAEKGRATGPVEPTSKPPSEEALRRAEEATLRGPMQAPGPGEEAAPSLEGVPRAWVERSRDEALAELDRLDRLLEAEPPQVEALKSALDRIQTAVRRIAEPSPPR